MQKSMKHGKLHFPVPVRMLLIVLAVSLPLLAPFQTSAAPSMEAVSFPCLYQIGTADPEESEMTLFFVRDGDTCSEIPYVPVPQYMTFLSGLLEKKHFGDIAFESHALSDTVLEVIRIDNGSTFVINASEQTLRFSDLNSFIQMQGQPSALSMIRIPGPYAGAAHLLSVSETDALSWPGDELVLKLGPYDIAMICADGTIYLPLQTLNDLFLGELYIQCVFTGEKVLCASYLSDLLLQKYDAPVGIFSEETAQYNYHELCFLLDHFYGLKEDLGVETFGDLLHAQTDPKAFDLELMQLTNRIMDDGHSGFGSGSVRSGPSGEKEADMSWHLAGPTLRSRDRSARVFAGAREIAYPDGVPAYEEVGDTAFLTIDDFSITRNDYYDVALLHDQPEDTVELVIYANRMIRREGSPIKKIVIDLSNNHGGEASAAAYVMSWFLGDAPITLTDTLTHARSSVIYHADVDLDGSFTQEADTVSQGCRLYCLTNTNAFSCGHLFAAACKESGRVILAGQKTGGGSCSVRPCTTVSGACFQISGPKQLAVRQNGSFLSMEDGVEPDIPIRGAVPFYDRTSLMECIDARLSRWGR